MFLSIEIKSNSQAMSTDTEHATARILRDIARQIELGAISGTPADDDGQQAGPPWSFVRLTAADKVDMSDDQRVAITALLENMNLEELIALLSSCHYRVADDVPAHALRDSIIYRVMEGQIDIHDLVIVESSRNEKEAKH
jgi:hypothetical protein